MPVNVFVERGVKRVFAGAVDWPGWCRSARDEAGALNMLATYRDRYARALGRSFTVPAASFHVVERAKGNATTDFGAPGVPLKLDATPLDDAELDCQLKILRACWRAFDRTAGRAGTLRAGPRGGGRTVHGIREHVLGAELAYVSALGGTKADDARAAFVAAVRARAAGEVDDVGPRGGKRWSPRFAIKREAWHALDHAWEIEDRS